MSNRRVCAFIIQNIYATKHETPRQSLGRFTSAIHRRQVFDVSIPTGLSIEHTLKSKTGGLQKTTVTRYNPPSIFLSCLLDTASYLICYPRYSRYMSITIFLLYYSSTKFTALYF